MILALISFGGLIVTTIAKFFVFAGRDSYYLMQLGWLILTVLFAAGAGALTQKRAEHDQHESKGPQSDI